MYGFIVDLGVSQWQFYSRRDCCYEEYAPHAIASGYLLEAIAGPVQMVCSTVGQSLIEIT